MIVNILSIIATLTSFLVIKYLVWYWTEGQKHYPSFLDYKPFNCKKCLGFWSLTSFYLTMMFIFKLKLMGVIGIMLTILDTIAIIIDEKKRFNYD